MTESRTMAEGDAPQRNFAKKSVKRIGTGSKLRTLNRIPDHILQNESLNAAMANLPSNYNFEIPKTIWKIITEKVTVVALQFPEGLLMYACIIADIIECYSGAKVIILGDVTYGACCIDDYTSKKLGASLLVHYGHSCLVPVNVTSIKILYVFVEIKFDISHLVETIRENFPPTIRLALLGTVQFTHEIHNAVLQLKTLFRNISIPQAKPLSSGETLGCTSPKLPDCDAFVFVADGRFHLESAIIQNPSVAAFRYDPYNKILSREGYDIASMKATRWEYIQKARTAKRFGIILGTLGRQGNVSIFNRIRQQLLSKGKTAMQFLMAEVVPSKLALVTSVDAWVQVACPRLSIDWGPGFEKPILTPYEFEVAMGLTEWSEVYHMDYYSGTGGAWSNYVASKSST